MPANMASSSTFSSGERRIVLVGRAGVGKSATGNTILGKKVFKETFSGVAVTKKAKEDKQIVFSKEILVVDTPGLFDIETSNEETMQEIVKCLLLSTPGPHVVAYVMRVDRVTAEIQKSFEIIKDTFGEDVQRYMLVIFTGKDDLENEETSIDEFIKDSPPFLNAVLSKCNNRYIAINNRAKGGDKIEQQKELMKVIDDLIEENGEQYYSNVVYDALTERIKKRVEEMRSNEETKSDDTEKGGLLDLIRQKISENQEEILEFVIEVAKFVGPLLLAQMAKRK